MTGGTSFATICGVTVGPNPPTGVRDALRVVLSIMRMALSGQGTLSDSIEHWHHQLTSISSLCSSFLQRRSCIVFADEAPLKHKVRHESSEILLRTACNRRCELMKQLVAHVGWLETESARRAVEVASSATARYGASETKAPPPRQTICRRLRRVLRTREFWMQIVMCAPSVQ